MKYRDFNTLTNDEIEFIIYDILNPHKIGKIRSKSKAFYCEVYFKEKDEEFLDIVELRVPDFFHTEGIESDTITFNCNEEWKWKQFLLAKGIDYRLCNNPYMEEDKETPMLVTNIHVDEYYCPNCGEENGAEQCKIWDRYCPRCGQRIYQKQKEAWEEYENE